MKQKGKAVWMPFVGVLMMVIAAIACSGANGTELSVDEQLANSRITELPAFICPSSTPRATATSVATQVQPPVYIPPSGYVTNTPVPGYTTCFTYYDYSIGSYVTNCSFPPMTYTPIPGGSYTNPGGYVPGATSTSRPTNTPYPTPTEYTRLTNYPMGADIWALGDLVVRFRVDNPRIVDNDPTDEWQISVWDIELENAGEIPYFSFPAAQAFVYETVAIDGTVTQRYSVSERQALLDAGIAVDPELEDILILEPGMVRTYTVAAFTPLGEIERIGWSLDPYSGTRGDDVVGGNVAYWINEIDPEGCEGNVEGPPWWNPFAVRTAVPTPTPTFTPDIPRCTGCDD